MKATDLMSMGLANVRRRKARTVLTMLGVIIGIISIVIMLSIGLGVKQLMLSQMAEFGEMNVITVNKPYDTGQRQTRKVVLDDKAVKIFEGMEHVDGVMEELSVQAKLVSGRYMAYVSIIGLDPKDAELFGYEIEKGRMIKKGDEFGIIYGSEVPYQFYNPKSRGNENVMYYMDGEEERPEPSVNVLKDRMIMTFDMSYGEERSAMENKLPYEEYKIRGTGLLKENFSNGSSWNAFMEMDQLKKLIKEKERVEGVRRNQSFDKTGYQMVQVHIDNTQNIEMVQEEIKAMGYTTYSMADSLKEINKVFMIIQMVLGGIGGISLLIAAIGITNTMTMAIYERTKEIGIMKVLGCELKDIKRLFLFEAGTISAMGGIIGLIISYGLSAVANMIVRSISASQGGTMTNEVVSIIPWWLALASIAFAILMGVVSGVYPAKRAMKLSALASIKNE